MRGNYSSKRKLIEQPNQADQPPPIGTVDGMMMIHFETNIDDIDWKQAAEVFRLAPLGGRDPDRLARAFSNSSAYVFAYDNERLIGLCRALCDGEYQAVIYDVVLLPEYHGRGIGKEMFNTLHGQLRVPNIILYAVRGKEGFYHKFGFKKMLTAMAILQPRLANPERGYLENEPTRQKAAGDEEEPRR